MSTPWTLPTWHSVADLNERDALQDFIYHQSPAGADEVAWREHVRAAIMVAHEELCAREARTAMLEFALRQYFEAKTPKAMLRADAVARELLKTPSTKAKQVFSDHQSSPADRSATSVMQPRLNGVEVAGDRQAFMGDPPHCPNCGCGEVNTDGC